MLFVKQHLWYVVDEFGWEAAYPHTSIFVLQKGSILEVIWGMFVYGILQFKHSK